MSAPTRLRQGHHVGRTLYEYPAGQDPASKTGDLVGMVDTPELAAEICEAVNAARDGLPHPQHPEDKETPK